MNKPVFLSLIGLTLLVILAVGCVSTSNDLVGTWTTGDYTSPDGTHYTKFVEVFNEDGTGLETAFLDDGTQITLNTTWIKTGDATYLYSYKAWVGTVSSDGKTCTYNDGSVYVREEGTTGTGLVGNWTCSRLHECDGESYSIKDVVRSDNTGSTIWTGANVTLTCDLVWYQTGENTYYISYVTDLVPLTILPDGTAKNYHHDLIYTRS